MIQDIMPTAIQKRRVVYCSDKLWHIVEHQAEIENKSISSTLREILKKKKGEYG